MQSEGARNLLAALADCNDELRAFAYQLYLRHKGSHWTQSLVISHRPFTISRYGKDEVYERCYLPSVSLHFSSSKSVAFIIYLCWDAEIWMVEADVEVNDNNEDDTKYLWELPSRQTQSLDEAIIYLVDATHQLIHYGEAANFNHLMQERD